MFVSTVPTLNTAVATDSRTEFAQSIEKLTDEQLRIVARARFGARLVTTSRRNRIALLLSLFDATDDFVGK